MRPDGHETSIPSVKLIGTLIPGIENSRFGKPGMCIPGTRSCPKPIMHYWHITIGHSPTPSIIRNSSIKAPTNGGSIIIICSYNCNCYNCSDLLLVTLFKLKEFKTKLKYACACHLCLHSSKRSIDRSVRCS